MNTKETFEVTGMTCNHCIMNVEKALKAVPGVQSASVDLASKIAAVEFDSEKTDAARLISAIDNSGYKGRRLP